MKIRGLVFMCFFVMSIMSILPQSVEAKIDFGAIEKSQIDIKKLSISESEFFSFISNLILGRPAGLGKYGRVPFRACDFEVEGKKLIDYNAPNGRGYEFLSNPSCEQMMIQRVLETSFGYGENKLDYYDNRQCIQSLEKIFSPMLEYYSIIYEEKVNPDCYLCDQKEKERLSKIMKAQRQINEDCKAEKENISRFLKDLDQVVEKTYQRKTR